MPQIPNDSNVRFTELFGYHLDLKEKRMNKNVFENISVAWQTSQI